jgi:phage terminase large subunit GpA-like protein
MNVFVEKKHVRRVVLQWAAQLGKTQILTGMLSRNVDLEPAPVIWTVPNEKFSTSFVRSRINPLIRDNPKLRNKFADPAKRDGRASQLERWFVGGNLFFASAESVADLSGRACKYGIVDEIDQMTASSHGDIVALVNNRLTTFWDSQLILTSTPGLEETSRIASEYAASSKGKWHVCCPKCEHAQVLSFDRLIDVDADVQHVCERCGDPSARSQWLAQSANTGHWIHETLVDEQGRQIASYGYWLDALVSPWVEWTTLREEERKAQAAIDQYKDYSLKQTYTNTRRALPWKTGGTEKADPDLLYNSNREDYGAGVEVPQGVKILVAGVDTQDDRLVFTVLGFGNGAEVWAIEHGVCWGDTSKIDLADPNNPWAQLQKLVLDRKFVCWNGALLRVECCFQDWGGHRSREVSQFVRGKQPRLWAIRGKGGKLNETFVISRNNEFRTPVVYISTDGIKSDLVLKLTMTEKGAGFHHFSADPARGFDKSYFEELTAEWTEVVVKDGFKKLVWTKLESQRNEAHDTATYAHAALLWHFRFKNLYEALAALPDPVSDGKNVREYKLRHEDNGAPKYQPIIPAAPQPTAPAPAPQRQTAAPARPIPGVSHWRRTIRK